MNQSQNKNEPDYAVRPLAPDRMRAIEEFAGPSVLDVGCGNGAYVLKYADRFSIRGIDHRPFEAWKQQPQLFSQGDAGRLDLADASVDTILSFETLEHLPDPTSALREYFRVCRRNIVATVPNCTLTDGMRKSGIIYNHWVDRSHVNFWTLDTISELVRNVGFQVTHARLINRISLGPVFAESMRLGGLLGRVTARLHHAISAPRYHMTCLIVGEKAQRAG